MSSNWAASANSHIWGQGKQVRWKFPPQAVHGGTRAKGSCRAQTQPLLYSCYQKSAETDSGTGKFTVRARCRGARTRRPTARKPPCHSLQKGLSTWSMGRFWKTELFLTSELKIWTYSCLCCLYLTKHLAQWAKWTPVVVFYLFSARHSSTGGYQQWNFASILHKRTAGPSQNSVAYLSIAIIH